MRRLVPLLAAAVLLCLAQDGKRTYETKCAFCHGADGNGGERAPGIVSRLPARTDAELAAVIHSGLPAAGMPPVPLPPVEMRALVAFLRELKPARGPEREQSTVKLAAGGEMSGLVLGRSAWELQLQTADRRIQLLRSTPEGYRPVTSDQDWPTYNGDFSANRYSSLAMIDTTNVGRLAPRWIFSIPGASRLQVTPVVVDGIMYVTAPNECYALDAGTGRQLWRYARRRTPGVIGDAGSGINRGVAVAGERLFMITDHAHLIALNRFTGALLWDVEMADYRQNYGATSAPLAIGRLVVSGHSGGDEGVRGFLAAYDQETGRQVWRFHTVPSPGDAAAATWKGSAIEHGCAATWLTGSYDRESDTLYWPTGNPCPDFNGDERLGDNLYSDSILALYVTSGKLKWHFQYTPHDVWDWDAQQPPVLVDADWNGTPRKLLLHANRNGFFYVLDRRTGELLLARPFVRKLTWAQEIGRDGRPVRVPSQEPSAQGTKVCPAVEGATNWFSTAYHPGTGLYYVQTLEKCDIYLKSPGKWEAGKAYYDGATRRPPGEKGEKILRAIDIRTGQAKWELPQSGPANSWGGVLATAGGLVFFGEDSGAFAAADARTGKLLWHYPTNQLWKASPMTYRFDGRQYIAVASGPSIIAFGLVD